MYQRGSYYRYVQATSCKKRRCGRKLTQCKYWGICIECKYWVHVQRSLWTTRYSSSTVLQDTIRYPTQGVVVHTALTQTFRSDTVTPNNKISMQFLFYNPGRLFQCLYVIFKVQRLFCGFSGFSLQCSKMLLPSIYLAKWKKEVHVYLQYSLLSLWGYFSSSAWHFYHHSEHNPMYQKLYYNTDSIYPRLIW